MNNRLEKMSHRRKAKHRRLKRKQICGKAQVDEESCLPGNLHTVEISKGEEEEFKGQY
jgi:hypothetical protein